VRADASGKIGFEMADEVIAKGGPGYSIRANDQQFAITAPLGTTRFDWTGVDGAFTEWSNMTVRFRLKPEYLAHRSMWFRLGVKATRAVDDFEGVSVDASRYGTTAEALAASLNERLAAKVGRVDVGADPETGLRVVKATPGPLRRYQQRLTWVVLAGAGVWFLVMRLH
jgi:hypothetical protein